MIKHWITLMKILCLLIYYIKFTVAEDQRYVPVNNDSSVNFIDGHKLTLFSNGNYSSAKQFYNYSVPLALPFSQLNVKMWMQDYVHNQINCEFTILTLNKIFQQNKKSFL